MARIGRKTKKKMQGTSSYAKKVVSPNSPSPPSNKRKRVNYKSRGISHAAPIEHRKDSPDSKSPVDRISARYSIYYTWVNRLDAPPEEDWKGRDGTIHTIRRMLGMPPHARSKIRRVLEEAMRCLRVGECFDGRIEPKNKVGRKVEILPGSAEELLMANWMESHVGFRMTTLLVNEHRREEGKENVSVSAVMSAFYRLQPKVNVLQKVQSGGLNQGWIDASYNVSKQMLVMLGKLTLDEVMTDDAGKSTLQQESNMCHLLVVVYINTHPTATTTINYSNPSRYYSSPLTLTHYSL